DNSLVSLNGRIIGPFFFTRPTDVVLSARGVFPVWRGPNYRGENFNGMIECVGHRDPEKFYLPPVQIHFANAELPFNRFVEMRTAGISLHDPSVRIRRGEIFAGLFLQFGRAKTRSWSERIFRMAFHECAVGIDRPLQVPFL